MRRGVLPLPRRRPLHALDAAPQQIDPVQIVTAPDPTQGPTGLSAHAPDHASAPYGPVTVPAGGGIQVQAGTTRLTGGLWDAVDAYGLITVSSLDGSELLVASMNAFFAEAGIDPVAVNLGGVGSIGSDLAIVSNTITSTAGGLFLVNVNAQAAWD